MKHLLIIFTISFSAIRLNAQMDSIPISKENLMCTYVIEKVWNDPHSAYKRDAIGEVNFFQIDKGVLMSAVRTASQKYSIIGTLDSIAIGNKGESSVLTVYLTTANDSKASNVEYIFEISQDSESIIIHGSPRRRLDDYYFLVHVATDEEMYGIQNYFKANAPKY